MPGRAPGEKVALLAGQRLRRSFAPSRPAQKRPCLPVYTQQCTEEQGAAALAFAEAQLRAFLRRQLEKQLAKAKLPPEEREARVQEGLANNDTTASCLWRFLGGALGG